jgi:hypothetical protein
MIFQQWIFLLLTRYFIVGVIIVIIHRGHMQQRSHRKPFNVFCIINGAGNFCPNVDESVCPNAEIWAFILKLAMFLYT